MKIDIKHFALAAAGATMLLTSCIGDLDTLPLNPSDSTSETVYGKDENGYLAGLTKLYFNFVSNDTTDLQVSDGGASELIRAFWTIQEVTADACKCAWENDAWVRAMNTDTWSDADNDATYAVYVRTLQGIAYVNEYLRQTASDKLSDRGVSSELAARIQSFRAEARFLRAYFYWIALDVFGDVPFTTETSPFGGGVNPKQASRKDVFDYCISELTDLASDESAMPAARSNYPRADKGAVNGLLARMYLNAEVYAGTPMWTEAKSACEAIFGMGYSLCPEYSDLFRGDNGENADALKEIIFGVAYDAEQTQSYGGTSYLTLAAIAATSAAMCFGKCCGIIDHSKKQHCRTAHDFRPPFRHGTQERVIELLPFGRLHLCRHFPPLIDHILQHGILEQTVHFGMYITRVFVCFFLQFFCPLLNGIHIFLELGKLSVSGL